MDRLTQENNKSQDKSSDAAIEAIYAVIASYNGIIRTIIERTEPAKGKWATRKSVDQSTIMYLAEVLKGLIEPLKHLEFQLNQVHDADLASLQNMMNNLVTIIDESPPFKALDIEKYKYGIPNYEGLSDDLNITDGTAYLALLESKRKMLETRLKDMKRVIRKTTGGEISKKIEDNATKALAAIKKEMTKARYLVNAQLEDVYVNTNVLGNIDSAIDALNELAEPEEFDYNEYQRIAIAKGMLPSLKKVKEKDEASAKKQSDRLAKEELQKELKELDIKIKNIESGYPYLIDPTSGEFNAQDTRFPQGHKEQYLELIEDKAKIIDKLTALGVKPPAPSPSPPPAPVAVAPPPPEAGAPPQPDASASNANGMNANEAPLESSVGRGAGRPLADLLANPKQQYNSMGRPVSNDQKIQNDMINANRNWQMKNNGPHDTPIGNLNPFLPQDKASKYSYEVLLAGENAMNHPESNARGADVSLLQGPITNIEGSGKKSKALLRLKKVAIDERNDPYGQVDLGSNGMIPEEKEDQFKLPDLKPKKRK
jgi:hypothetical protein